jgi:hypothetical protein
MNNLLSFLRSGTLFNQTRNEHVYVQVRLRDTKTEVRVVTYPFNYRDWHYCGNNKNVTNIEILSLKSSEERFIVSITHAHVYSYWLTSDLLLESKYIDDMKNIFWTSNAVSETTERYYSYKVYIYDNKL